jgi:hypothetical protein
MLLKTCHIKILPHEIHEINVRVPSAWNCVVDADERESNREILVHDIVTADIGGVRGVKLKGPQKKVC